MNRFIDNGDGSETDSITGLIWTKTTVAKDVTHKQAGAAVKKLRVAGHKDWDLPTVEELFPLADRSRKLPAIDTDAFPDTESDLYWTKTDSAWSSGSAWVVSFGHGYASGFPRGGKACVRAVRRVPAGQ